MFWILQAVVVFSVSEETKIEVDTSSKVLSYSNHFGDVKKELFRYCLSPAYETMQAKHHMTQLIKFLYLLSSPRGQIGSEI